MLPSKLGPALALALVATLALAACGGEDAQLLPGETSQEILANLETVRLLADEGDCVGAESAAEQVGEQIAALEGVDAKLKRALENGAVRLEEVISECDEEPEEEVETTTTTEAEDEGKPGKGKAKGKERGEEGETEERTSPSQPEREEGEGEGGNQAPSEEAPEEGGEESPSGGLSPAAPAGGGE